MIIDNMNSWNGISDLTANLVSSELTKTNATNCSILFLPFYEWLLFIFLQKNYQN